MRGRGLVGVFVLLGAVSGVLSALGVMFVEKGFFILDDRLVAITPAVFYSIAIIAGFRASQIAVRPIHLLVVPLLVYLTWYLAVQAALRSSPYILLPPAIIVGGIVGATLLAILLSTIVPVLRRLSTIVLLGVVGGIGAIPFAISDWAGFGEYTWHFVLFVCWQPAVLAAIGYFSRPALR